MKRKLDDLTHAISSGDSAATWLMLMNLTMSYLLHVYGREAICRWVPSIRSMTFLVSFLENTIDRYFFLFIKTESFMTPERHERYNYKYINIIILRHPANGIRKSVTVLFSSLGSKLSIKQISWNFLIYTVNLL